MKLSTSIILASITGVSAFTSPSTSLHKNVALRMAEESNEPVNVVEEIATKAIEPVAPQTPPAPEMSMSLPFMERPPALDGTMVGDVGFDPFGFAKTKDDLIKYREAEIKHARLAMLAAAGWPLSELFDRPIANMIGAPAIVDATDRAPSVLNGGLGKISPIYWAVCLLGAAAIDLYGTKRSQSNDPEYFPGNLGFDPLGLYPKDKAGQERMQLTELKNGRLAMIAITAFAFQEFVRNVGVVDATPIFFKPLGEVLKDYANQGYYQP